MMSQRMYALCHGCEEHVPRDEMYGVNVVAYDFDPENLKIIIRMCKPCQERLVGSLSAFRWENELIPESELPKNG